MFLGNCFGQSARTESESVPTTGFKREGQQELLFPVAFTRIGRTL